MIKQNQYYKLIKHIYKQKTAKVYNFKTKNIEIYNTVLSQKEKFLQKKARCNRRKKLSIIPKRIIQSRYIFQKKKGRSLSEMVSFFCMYKRYKNCFYLPKNNLFYSLVIRHLFKKFKRSMRGSGKLFRRGYQYKLDQVIGDRYNIFLNIISIYVNLRRNNIFITIVNNNNKILKIFSPCLFRHIQKKARKKSASFFYTVKRTLIYLRRFIFFKRRKYFFKIFFKGFQTFRRPLLSRFLYNKRLKSKCLGIYNLDFESFNGCRLKKSKRIKIRGQRKQKKRFSL